MKKIILLMIFYFLYSCNGTSEAPFDVAGSDKERDLAPSVTDSDYNQFLAGNREFALDLYAGLLGKDGNLFYSPFSMSLALAMTYAGAKGNTAVEMAEVLTFPLSPDKLHPAFNKLDLLLSSLGSDTKDEDFTLSIENSLWGEKTYEFRGDYLDIIAVNYGASMYLLDFVNRPDESRQIINEWIEEQTKEKIKNLLPEGSLTTMTRLVLTNAIYFYGSWLKQFNKEMTAEKPFNLTDGTLVNVPMMSLTDDFLYTNGQGFQAVKLPYEGGETGMLIIVPDKGTFAGFEKNFNSLTLSNISESLETVHVELSMPKWEFESEFAMKDTLMKMGMDDAFTARLADFSGIDGTMNLFISNVFHKAFVSVDEFGTEAAAATAVTVGVTSIPPGPEVTLTIDRPFIFLISDFSIDTILFAGRVVNPGI